MKDEDAFSKIELIITSSITFQMPDSIFCKWRRLAGPPRRFQYRNGKCKNFLKFYFYEGIVLKIIT